MKQFFTKHAVHEKNVLCFTHFFISAFIIPFIFIFQPAQAENTCTFNAAASVFKNSAFVGLPTNESYDLEMLFLPACAGRPDSTETDSTETTMYADGDTMGMYVIGVDTVYIIYEDTASYGLHLRESDNPEGIYKIALTDQIYNVQTGLLGMNITDLFEPGHANETLDLPKYPAGETPWDYLSELTPKTLRVFSGQGSRFMELFGSPRTAPNDPLNTTGTAMNGGYGFCMERIIPFFDATEDMESAPPLFPDPLDPGGSITEDIETDGDIDGTWLHHTFENTFKDFYNKWLKQPVFEVSDYSSVEEYPLYINEFIRLVQKIENENPGHTVDVVLCFNILSETATDCVNTLEYLLDNDMYDLNVRGIELGNEVYFDWAAEMMGFTDHGPVNAFIHYWDYINGYEYDSGTSGVDAGDGTYNATDFDLSTTLPADVLADHDFISAIKTNPETQNIKIGLPAYNLPNCGEYAFITDPGEDTSSNIGIGGTSVPNYDCPDCFYPPWNDDVASKYSNTIPSGSVYKFDAVIMHPYYLPLNVNIDYHELCNTNWYGIPRCLTGGTYTEPWDYTAYDEDLLCAFDGILGFPVSYSSGDPEEVREGNFREFITQDLKEVMDEHRGHLNFAAGDTGPENKEIWYTEYNLQDDDKNIPEEEQDYVNSVINTFAHAEVLWNWILWNMKSNTHVNYRPDYFTVATLQAFLLGTPIALMSDVDKD